MINLNLDLRKKDGFNKAYTARMGDKGEQFTVTLFDDSLPATIPSGATVTLVVKTRSGKYASTVGTVKGNVVTFTLNGEITSEAGYYQRCYVEVRTTTTTRTTQDIIFFSLGNSDISQGDADHYISLLDELLQELNDKFNKWLADREKDYKDLLDRINALNTRLTGLENDVNEIMTKFRLTRAYRMADGTFSKRLPPVNLFSPTQLLQTVVGTTITKTGFKKDNADMIGGWAAEIMNHAQLTKLLKPNTQYSIYYEYKVLSRDTLGAKYVNSSNGTMIIYSGVNPTTYPTVDLRSGSQGFPEEFTNVKVGDILKRGATFTTPSNLNDSASNYRILFYTMRGTDASGKEIVKEAGEFLNIKISTGDDTVIYTTNPDDDIVNAYPKWHGLGLQSSTNPDDYQWDLAVTYSENRDDRFALADGKLRVLPNTVDLNSVTETGNYIVAGSPNSPANEPNSSVLNVFNGGSEQMVVQLFTGMGSNQMHFRTRHVNFDWFEWKKIDMTPSTGFVKLVQAQDFNNMKVTQTVVNANATTALHAPMAGTFLVEIFEHNSSYVVQRATHLSSTNQVFHRQLINNTWSPWYKYDIKPAVGSVTQVPDGTDLNTKTMTDIFFGSTLVNAPVAGSGVIFYVEVISTNGSNDCVQTATLRRADTRTFKRQRINGVWHPWVEIDRSNIDGKLSQSPDGTDLNTLVTNIKTWGTNFKNVPINVASANYYVEVEAIGSSSCKQTVVLQDLNDRTFTRQKVAANWSAWREVVKTLPDANLPRVDVTEWKTGWGHYSTNTHLTVRKVNGWVSLNGAFTNTVEFASGSQDEVVVCVLPVGYRPDVDITGLRRNASGTTTYMLGIRTTGEVIYTRHTDPGHSGYVGVQAPGKWFTTNASFIGA